MTKHRPDLDPDALQQALARVEIVDDPLEFMSRCILAMAPGFSRAVLEAAERHAVEQLGGDAYYIGRRGAQARERRNADIRREHQAGERIQFLMRRYKLSRPQIYAILSAKPSA